MSAMINIGPMVAKVVRDMMEEQGAILDVDTVYKRLDAHHGDEIYAASRKLAEIAVRQKIKVQLKKAHTVTAGPDGQMILIHDDAPATLPVKQVDGTYAYIPLHLASVNDLDAATKARADNIAHVQTAFDKWAKTTKPVRAVMETEGVNYGEAQQIIRQREAQEITADKIASV